MNNLIILSGLKGSGKSTCGSFLMKNYGYHQMSFASRLKDIVAWVYDLPRNRLDGLTEKDREWREQPHPNLQGGWVNNPTGGYIERHDLKWIDKGYEVLEKVYGISKPESFSTSYPFLYDHSYLKLLNLLYRALRVNVYKYPGMLSPRQALQIIGTEVFRAIHLDTWCLALQVQIEQLRKDDPSCKIVVTDGRFENEAIWGKSQGALLIYVDRLIKAIDSHSSEDTSRFKELANIVLLNERGLDELECSLLALVACSKKLIDKQFMEV